MTFNHALFPRTEITDTTIEGVGRVYHTPVGDLDSVTTIIGRKLDNSWLKAWRDAVGDDVADQVSQQARNRGTAIHNLAEKYVLNDPQWAKGAMPVNVATFKKIGRVLDRGVQLVYGVEYPLYSKLLNTAGRSDLPCQFMGLDSIVDFKTSKKMKTKEDIEGYFIQSATYALMFEELTGLMLPQIAVVIAVDETDEAQVFLERTSRWFKRVHEVFIK